MAKTNISPIGQGRPKEYKDFIGQGSTETYTTATVMPEPQETPVKKAKNTGKPARLTVNIDADQYKELRAKALQEGTSVTTLVNKWVAKYLKK